MGVSTNLHIGVYLIVQSIPGNKTIEKQVCVNTACKKHNKEVTFNFCPACGVKTEKKPFTIEDSTSINEFLHDDDKGNWGNKFYSVHGGGVDIYDDKDIVIPNTDDHSMEGVDIDECGETPMATFHQGGAESEDIEEHEDPKSVLMNFVQEEKEFLEALTAEGFTYSIHYGVVVHAS